MMNKHPVDDPYYDPLIAEAVKCMPQAEPPADLLPAVMKEVRPDALPLPWSLLSWLDVSLALFFSIMLGLLAGGIVLLTNNIQEDSIGWALQILRTYPPMLLVSVLAPPAVALAGAAVLLGLYGIQASSQRDIHLL